MTKKEEFQEKFCNKIWRGQDYEYYLTPHKAPFDKVWEWIENNSGPEQPDNEKDEDEEDEEDSVETIERWAWMMDYCKRCNLPPAQLWAWGEAEQAWKEHKNAGN